LTVHYSGSKGGICVGEDRSIQRAHEAHLVGGSNIGAQTANGVRLTIMASQRRITASIARLIASPRSVTGSVGSVPGASSIGNTPTSPWDSQIPRFRARKICSGMRRQVPCPIGPLSIHGLPLQGGTTADAPTRCDRSTTNAPGSAQRHSPSTFQSPLRSGSAEARPGGSCRSRSGCLYAAGPPIDVPLQPTG
jgi:hypothetical protein